MSAPFETLSEHLLRGGIAPRYVRRYVRELDEHFADAVAAAQASGLSLAQAQCVAKARLGRVETLAAAMLAQPGLRSAVVRRPWLVLGLSPVLSVLGMLIFLPCLLAFAVHHMPVTVVPGWVSFGVAGYVWLVNAVGGMLVIIAFGWLARGQRCCGRWAVAGLSLAALCGAAFTVSIHLAGGHGFVALSSPLGPHGDLLQGMAGGTMCLVRLVLGLLAGSSVLWLRRPCFARVPD